mgnify:CR=1 FL=1
MRWTMFHGHAINKVYFQRVNLQWGANYSSVMQSLVQQQTFFQSLLRFVLYGHYYINYIPYDQKTANKEHDCEYITQLGQRKMIN